MTEELEARIAELEEALAVVPVLTAKLLEVEDRLQEHHSVGALNGVVIGDTCPICGDRRADDAVQGP